MFVTMLAARRALLALTVLFASAYALQNKCASITMGSTAGTPSDIMESVMPPGQADFDVKIANVCPFRSYKIGWKVTACDTDVKPDLVAYSSVNVYVHRNGNLASYGRIYVTVYCRAAQARSRYASLAEPYQTFGVQNANDAHRPRVSGVLTSDAFDPHAYDYGYATPVVHAPDSSYEHGPHYAFDVPKRYLEYSKVDVARPYRPYGPLVPLDVPHRQK